MSRVAGRFELREETFVNRPLGDVFEFFSRPENLELLTPPWLRFRIVTPLPIELRQGTTIDYRLRLRGLPLRWRSLIPVWEPPHRFVDEQLKGPYRTWVHEHRFTSEEGGTRVLDHVRYDLLCGRIVQPIFVRRDLQRIFAYRTEALQRHFSREAPVTERETPTS